MTTTRASVSENLSGLFFGNWEVLHRAVRQYYWVCRCACDKQTVRDVWYANLQTGKSRGCGCLAVKPVIDLVGQAFGRLLVVARDTSCVGKPWWWVLCACGVRKRVAGNALRTGTRSCGKKCESRPKTLPRQFPREYRIWCGMRGRMHAQPGSPAYARYAARLGPVHLSWQGRRGFQNFMKDMGPCPPGFSLDRKNNDLGYGPDNCRWATRVQQARNRRSTVMLTVNGVTKSLRGWAETPGVSATWQTIRARTRLGWSPAETVFAPPYAYGRQPVCVP